MDDEKQTKKRDEWYYFVILWLLKIKFFLLYGILRNYNMENVWKSVEGLVQNF